MNKFVNRMNITAEKRLLDRIGSGLFSWIDFEKGSKILCIDEKDGILSFLDCKYNIKYISRSTINELNDKYDYILWRNFDNIHDISDNLNRVNMLLTEKGIAYLGFINKNSIRRWCGDSSFIGKHSKNNIINIFKRANIDSIKLYSVFPDLFYPQIIISEDFYPNEIMQIRYFPIYNNPRDINVDERAMLDFLISNKRLHEFANSYLVEYRINNNQIPDYKYVTLSMDRSDNNACNTIIFNNFVIKKYPFCINDSKIKILKENELYLQSRGVLIAKSFIDDYYKVPFYNTMILTTKLYESIKTNICEFYSIFDRYKDIVYSSSEAVKTENNVPVLKKCFIDLVPLNCLWDNNEFIFIDQEFFIENESANVIIWRAIKILFLSYPDVSNYISESDLLKRYNIDDFSEKKFNYISNDFISNLRNKKTMRKFYSKHSINVEQLQDNKKILLLKEKITEKSAKKYNVGYVAGVFDLFHIGHLNLLKNAKEKCDYLIVGVVSDRGVIENKKTELYIPFEERLEIVSACKYVDEAHEIPFDRCTSMDAFDIYHFDVQFSGDDYKDNPAWLKVKDFLERNGSGMEFLPYTKNSSSTKIKNMIKNKHLLS